MVTIEVVTSDQITHREIGLHCTSACIHIQILKRIHTWKYVYTPPKIYYVYILTGTYVNMYIHIYLHLYL